MSGAVYVCKHGIHVALDWSFPPKWALTLCVLKSCESKWSDYKVRGSEETKIMMSEYIKGKSFWRDVRKSVKLVLPFTNSSSIELNMLDELLLILLIKFLPFPCFLKLLSESLLAFVSSMVSSRDEQFLSIILKFLELVFSFSTKWILSSDFWV